MANTNAQTLRKIMLDLELSGRAAFDKEERRLVLQILLELVEKMARLGEDAVQARQIEGIGGRLRIDSRIDSEN